MDVTTEQRNIAIKLGTMGIPFSPEYVRVAARRAMFTRQIIGMFLSDIDNQVGMRFRADTFKGELFKRSEDGFIDAAPSGNVGRLIAWEVLYHIKDAQKSGQRAVRDALDVQWGVFHRLDQH